MLDVPWAWFPRLMAASPAERGAVEVGALGLHWMRSARRTVRVGRSRERRPGAPDEDVSVEGLLAGRGDRTARGLEAM